MAVEFLNETQEESDLLRQMQEADDEPVDDTPEDDAPETDDSEQEQVEEPVDDTPPQPKPKKMVPLAEVQKYRVKTRELNRRVEDLDKAAKLANERFFKLVEQINAGNAPKQQETPQEPEIKLPDPNADPIGYLQARVEQQNRLIEDLKKGQEAVNQERQGQQQHSAMQNWVLGKEEEFRADNPDYNDAFTYAVNRRKNELLALNYNHDQAMQILQGEVRSISYKAFQEGGNPAEVIYNYAKATGFSSPRKAQEPMATNTKKNPVKDVSEKISNGRRMPSGSSPDGTVSPEQLLQMDDDEFDKHFEKVLRGGGKGKRTGMWS